MDRFKAETHTQSEELTSVQINTSLSDDDLRGDGNIWITFVQHFSNLQQHMRAVHPVQQTVGEENHCDRPLGLVGCDAVSEKHLKSQQLSDHEFSAVIYRKRRSHRYQ